MEYALRRSGVLFWWVLDGRNKECCCCFRQFARDFLEIASSGSGNAVPVLGICKQFDRNGALSNGFQGTPHKGVSCFLLDSRNTCACRVLVFNPAIGTP